MSFAHREPPAALEAGWRVERERESDDTVGEWPSASARRRTDAARLICKRRSASASTCLRRARMPFSRRLSTRCARACTRRHRCRQRRPSVCTLARGRRSSCEPTSERAALEVRQRDHGYRPAATLTARHRSATSRAVTDTSLRPGERTTSRLRAHRDGGASGFCWSAVCTRVCGASSRANCDAHRRRCRCRHSARAAHERVSATPTLAHAHAPACTRELHGRVHMQKRASRMAFSNTTSALMAYERI